MGQYRLWLHYREVDQQLRAELELLEKGLAHLQEQAGRLEESAACTDNVIVQALQAFTGSHTTQVPFEYIPNTPSEQVALNGGYDTTEQPALNGTTAEQPTTTVSRALFAWSNLPNFNTHEVPVPVPDTPAHPSLPPTPHPDLDSLSQEMSILPDEQAGEAPQLQLPWWLHNVIASSTTRQSDSNGLIDQQSIRTNQLVQRWLERWGRRSDDQEESREEQV
jgi:hypothetical protein